MSFKDLTELLDPRSSLIDQTMKYGIALKCHYEEMSPGYQKIKSFKDLLHPQLKTNLCVIRQQYSDLQIDKVNSTNKYLLQKHRLLLFFFAKLYTNCARPNLNPTYIQTRYPIRIKLWFYVTLFIIIISTKNKFSSTLLKVRDKNRPHN